MVRRNKHNSITNFQSLLFRIWLLGFALLSSCIDTFSIETIESRSILAVDGLITTENGPHQIKLTVSDKYGDISEGIVRAMTDAKVVIRDNEGNVTNLVEYIQDSVTYYNSRPPSPFTNPAFIVPIGWITIAVFRKTGVYQTTSNFKAEVGKSYTLEIELPNGKRYSSLPEKIVPVPEITDLNYRSYRTPNFNPILDQSGFDVYSQFTDNDSCQYYLWRLSDSVYPYLTTPEEMGIECCNRCYRYFDQELNNAFAISSDELFNNLSTTAKTITIADDGWRFKDKLRVKFHQHSISERGYQFLNLIQQQLLVKGSVFDPPPANIRGNMIDLDDPTQQVLGYFFATDVSTRELYLDGNNLIYKQTPGHWPFDSREVKGLGYRLSTESPVGWKY